MCGIAGVVGCSELVPGEESGVRDMLAVLAHRGPDDEHLLADVRAVMGARRLSIIDLDTGRQPLTDESGGIWVSQNGEIYNYLELRSSLRDAGHTLASSGDTEVIAHLYEDYGDDFVLHLRGMFAVAIWDRARRRLVLARDRVGKKPLYWHLTPERFAYASELKALIVRPDVAREIDPVSLAQYLQYQYVPSPRSILLGIHKLPPASVLVWDGGEPRIHRYWELDYAPKDGRPVEEQRERCLELLRESTRLRMRSDVPVGVFLSGGMDSSVVTALMAEASPAPVRTLSIGFQERGYDELPYARRVAQQFSTDHSEDIVTLDAAAMLPDLAHHFDEPFGDSSALPTYRVAQLARGLKVVLTGDGGDESFAGYDRYRLQALMAVVDATPRPVRASFAFVAPLILAAIRRRRRPMAWQSFAEMGFDQRYVHLMSIFRGEIQEEILQDASATHQDPYLLAKMASAPKGAVDRLLATDVATYLPEDLLVKVDRATMANSLEARSPLLDHKLMEFAAALPENRKLRRGRSKALLRDVAHQLLPRSVVDRPKMGFGVPIAAWFTAELGDRYTDAVLASDATTRDLIDQTAASRLLADHRSGRSDHAHRLWLLLMLELWGRTWLRKPVGILT